MTAIRNPCDIFTSTASEILLQLYYKLHIWWIFVWLDFLNLFEDVSDNVMCDIAAAGNHNGKCDNEMLHWPWWNAIYSTMLKLSSHELISITNMRTNKHTAQNCHLCGMDEYIDYWSRYFCWSFFISTFQLLNDGPLVNFRVILPPLSFRSYLSIIRACHTCSSISLFFLSFYFSSV